MSQPSAVQQPKHDGGKDDLDAIGTRKMGRKGVGNWYSLEDEMSLGKRYAEVVESNVKLVHDPIVNEYVNRIGQNLVRNSDAQVPFTIKVIDSDDINAFSLPGGFMYVNYGLLLEAEDEAELAGVLAHEIAHVAARHATRQMTRSSWLSLATIPLVFVGGPAGYAALGVARLAGPLSTSKFSRNFEAEADYLGLEYLYKAGYDPQAFISFFERVQAQEKKKPGKLSKALSTHPQTADRVKKIQSQIARVLPPRELYIVTTSDFEHVKMRLHMLQNHRLQNEQRRSGPTLRQNRADSSGDPDVDDERPH